MKVAMLMPQMGESITEAIISRWLVKPGDRVEKGRIVLEISTDKIDSEIPAPEAGVIVELLAREGDTVPVKKVIAYIETGSPQERFYSPLVKSLAEKHGLEDSELAAINGSGEGGRVTRQDVLDHVEKHPPEAAPREPALKPEKPSIEPQQTPERPALVPDSKPSQYLGPDWGTEDQITVPMDNVRLAIAEHMVRSKHTSPHVYSIQEVDMSAVLRWRNLHRAAFEKNEKFKLSVTPFFMEAAVQGLLKFPSMNASVDGRSIILKRHINLGCAVALGNSGLIVPVIRHAEERDFVGLARALEDLSSRARSGRLLPDDVAGGTFTLTNPGVFGTLIGTPIINQPQVAILCAGVIKKRPVVIDDMIAVREMCYLTLSYDHRVVDGALAGQFLGFICGYLENWNAELEL